MVVDDELTGIEVTPIDSTPVVDVAPADLDLPAITTETATDVGGPAASSGSSDGTVVATPPATGAAGGSASPTAADPTSGSTAPATTETTTPDSTLLPTADPAANPGSGRSPPALTAAELDPVVAAATAEWIAARPDADFTGLTVSIDDLAGMQLGYTVGTTVTIDLDAAGWGWDVSGGAADSHMSLHAVVLHELGHVLGLEHGDEGIMQPSLHPGETRDLVAPVASTGSPSAGATEASGAAESILDIIGATLAQYVTGAISGDHEFTASDVNIGGVLTILAPTLRFESIVVSGTGASPIFSGTVSVSSASATLNVLSGTTTFTGSATDLLGSYTLATQAATGGLLRLAAQNLQISISGFAAVTAAAVVLESQRSGTTTEVRVGARGATATLGAATDPRVQVSGASLAVLARKADSAASPTFAVIASGNAALIAATGITLTGANWRVAYNDLGDLSAAPVAVETGSGSVAVNFAANVRSVSGTGTVTVSTLGGITGSFAVTAASGQLNVQVSDATSAVTAGTASARLSSASGTFTINGSGLTGSAQGALSLEGLPGLSAQGTLDLQVDSAATIPYFRLVGTGRLAIAAFLELSGTLQFERSGPDVGVTVTGTSTSASLSLASTGAITGSGTTRVSLPVVIPGLTLDGTVTLAITPSSVSASGAVTLTTPVGEATGTLTFTKNLALNELSVSGTGISLFLGNRGADASSDAGLVLGSAAADAVVRANGSYALRVSGSASLANVSSATVAFSGGPFVAELNTTGADVTLGAATVAADTSRFVGIGVTLTVAGFSALGTFAVQSFVSAGAREVLLAAVGVAASAGPVQVTNADLLFLVASDGKLTLQATGAATIAGTTALTLNGNVGFKYNTREARVTRELIVAGLTRLLDVQAASSSGAFARFGGEGLALGILGQELSGDFELLAGSGNVSVTITNAKLKLGGGLVRAEALSAIAFQISAAGAISATALGFDSVVVNAPSIGVNGSVSASLDVGGASDHVKVAVGNTSSIANLDIAGETISGVFTFEQTGAGLVTVDAQNVSVTLGTVASATASGQLQLASDGIAAKLTAQVTVLTVPTVAFAATPYTGSLDVNTRPTAVASLSLPAGPFVRLTIVVGSALSVGGLGTIQGTFAFQRSGTGPSALTFVGISGATLVIGAQSITNGEGALLITGTGVAGFVSGTLSSATVAVSVNTTGGAVDETLNVGGRELVIRFGPDESPIFRLSVSGLSLNIGGGVTIEGNLVFETRGDGSRVFAGTGLRIFFGDGPLILANGERNPLARGIVLTNATIGLLNDGTDYALDALGDFELVGGGSVTVSGQGHVRVNTFEEDIDETLTIPGGSATVTVKFTGTSQQGSAGGPYVAIAGIGLELKLMGQTLTGDLSFQKTTGGLKVVASNVELALGDNGSGESARGPPFLTLSNAAGELVITSSGVVAKLTGGVQLALDGVSLTGAFDLLVNTTGNPGTAGGTSLPPGPYFRLTTVSATATLTVLGLQLSGRFTVEQALEDGATVTRLSATGVQLSLKAGATEVLSFGSGAGSLTLSSAGIVGSLSATVSTTHAAFDLSAGVSIAFDTTAAGRYVRVQADERDGDAGRRWADAHR